MALPTQEDFLANVLKLVKHAHEDCPICTSPMTSPARLPCKHEFCKGCITKWLTQPKVNNCPMCRRRLFKPVLSAREEADLEEQTANEAQRAADNLEIAETRAELARSLNASRLLVMNIDNYDVRAWIAEENTRDEVRAHLARRRIANLRLVAVEDAFMAAGLVHALRRNALTDFRSADVLTLNNSDLPRLQQGAVRIVAESVGTSLILISNALMRLASSENRPWSVMNQRIWRRMVINIWRLVSPKNDLLFDSQSLHLAIMSCALQQCHGGDEQYITLPFFPSQQEPDFVRELRFMVHFVVDHAGPTMESDVLREEPRVLTMTVSHWAQHLAAKYTNMAFVRA
jgi:hypothetical protein